MTEYRAGHVTERTPPLRRIAGLGATLLTFSALAFTGLTAAATGGARPGDTAAAGCPAAPALPRTSTRFGVSLTARSGFSLAQSLAKQEQSFGHLKIARMFDPSVPPANAWDRRASMFTTRSVVTSFRMPPRDVLAGRYDSAMRAFFSHAPTGAPIFWTYWHEPERGILDGKFTMAQFKSAWRRLAGIAASTCHSNLYPTLVLTGWTTQAASKRSWWDYYPGADVVSVVAFDPYNNAFGKATSYPDPATLFASVAKAGKASGKPWGVAETGSNIIPGDSTGAGRAAWLRKVGSFFSSQGAAFVTYFQSRNDGDFELRDAPSVSAWRSWAQF